MDFLISSRELSATIIEECRCYRSDDDVTRLEVTKSESFSVYTFSNTAVHNEREVIYWDGQFSKNARYRHSLFPESYPDSSEVKEIVKFNNIANGIFCAFYVDVASNRFQLTRDNLSQYPIYYVKDGIDYYVSNNARMLDALKLGWGRNVLGSIENCIYGGVFENTHINKVQLLEYGKSLTGGDELYVLEEKSSNFYASNYTEAISNAYADISLHIKSVRDFYGTNEIICDLTGGTDSRVLLMLILDSYNKEDVSFRCMGKYPNPDANVAAYIMDKYSLKKSKFLNSNVSIEEKVRNSSAISGGTIQSDVAFGGTKFNDLIHYHGAFGEVGGYESFNPYSFLSAQNKSYTYRKHAEIISDRRYRAGITDIVSKSAAKYCEHRFASYLEKLADSGVEDEALSMETYLRVRTKSHFGYQSYISNKTKVMPSIFANRWLLEARNFLDLKVASKKKVLFDLACLTNGDNYLWEPMAGKKWNEIIIPDSFQKNFEGIKVVTGQSSNLSGFTGSLFEMVNVDKKRPYCRLPEYNIEVKQNSSIHSGKLSTYINMAQLFLTEYEASHDIWRYWDKLTIEKRVRDSDSSFRDDGLDIEVLGLFLSSACWFTGLDQWRGATYE